MPRRVTGPRLAAAIAAAVALVVLIAWQAGLFRTSAAAGRDAGAGVAVRVVSPVLRDAPVYLASIGTVQAFNSVLIRARIDGEISRIAFREGQAVKRGEVLVELDRRPLEAQLRSALAQRDKDAAALENARLDLVRYAALAETGSGPEQTRDTAKSLVRQLEATVRNDDAQSEAARLQVAYATIRSPIDGVAGARQIDVGNTVHASDTSGVVLVTQIHPIFVSFALPQKALPPLREHQAAHPLEVNAFAQDGPQQLGAGQLTLIDNQIDPATGTFRCKATFDNSHDALWPGQFVAVRVVLENLRHALTIPTSAIADGANGPYVYVAKDGVASPRQVRLGPALGDATVIAAGLAPTELVIVEGQFQIEPGAKVTIKSDAAARNDAAADGTAAPPSPTGGNRG